MIAGFHRTYRWCMDDVQAAHGKDDMSNTPESSAGLQTVAAIVREYVEDLSLVSVSRTSSTSVGDVVRAARRKWRLG